MSNARRSSPECAVKILQLAKIPQGRDLESFTELLTKRRHSEAVTSFSRDDIVVVTIDAVVALTPSPLSVIVEGGEGLDVFVSVFSSSSGNVGREIDTLEFELVDFVWLSSSSSSSPKGEVPVTLVPVLLLWVPGLLPPPPRIPRRKTGPRIRITSATIALTFASIL